MPADVTIDNRHVPHFGAPSCSVESDQEGRREGDGGQSVERLVSAGARRVEVDHTVEIIAGVCMIE